MRTRLVLGLMAALLGAPLAMAQSTDGQERKVAIFNGLGATMTAFEAAPAGDEGWSGNRLPEGGLAPGSTVELEIDDGKGTCRFDFKAVFADGRVIERQRINVCQVSEYRYE